MSSVPLRELTDRAVRCDLGISVARAADLCGVAKNTLTMWELAPERARATTRAACAKVYKALRLVLEAAPGR